MLWLLLLLLPSSEAVDFQPRHIHLSLGIYTIFSPSFY
jgi:hypothetical protein